MLNFLKVFAILNKKIQGLSLNLNSQQNEINGLQEDVNELKQTKSILSAGINNAVSITTSGDNTIAIDKEISKIGNKITIDEGKIKINDDMNILISVKVQMTLKNNSGNTKNIYIHKYGASVIDILNEVYRTADNWRFSASASDIPISVAKNDVIELKGYFGVGDIIQSQNSRTYITVKEV